MFSHDEIKLKLLEIARDIYAAQGSKFTGGPEAAAKGIDKLFQAIHDSVLKAFAKRPDVQPSTAEAMAKR